VNFILTAASSCAGLENECAPQQRYARNNDWMTTVINEHFRVQWSMPFKFDRRE